MNEVLINHLDTMLGVEPDAKHEVQTTTKTQLTKISDKTEEESEFENDFDAARNTLGRILVKTEDAFDELVEIAKISEHPRAFEVVASTAKVMADIADSLVKLHSARAKTPAPQQSLPNVGNINNAIFTTSEDLIKALKNGQ